MSSGLSTALDELHPAAAKIADLKKETLEREASVLKAIIKSTDSLSVMTYGAGILSILFLNARLKITT